MGTEQMPEVSNLVEELLPRARVSSERAYSPYSKVKVGAVVVGADGSVFSGCNVENASYGLTQCAERNALAAAIDAGQKPGTMKTLLVYSNEFHALSPCGACRQVICEILAEDAVVISCSDNDDPKAWSITQLLPDPFTLE